MDPFAKFPTEIVCQILESCCDFTSLDGLQQISPRSVEPRRPMASDANVVDWVNRRLPPPKGGELIQFDVDPPSWIETYRTHRGLWKLELFHQIHNAATNHWLWSTHDLDCFIEQYLEWCRYPGGIEELQTISECVVDLCSSKPTILSHRASYLVAIPLLFDLTVQTCWPLPNIQDTQVDSTWRRSPRFVKGRNAVLGSFNALRGGEKGRSYHALWKVDFKAFRRIGIPL
ncbi:hypothetical protein N7448_006215 [Penicillium atrosanguineum]|nr:hypothetical protein N7448_006215 [Penicillium atrosanguineum]